MTLFLCIVLLGSNFLPVWYASSLNSLFGLAAYIICHIVRYSSTGLLCAEAQKRRADILTIEVFVFWFTFHIMSVPQIFFLFMSKKSLEAALIEDIG